MYDFRRTMVLVGWMLKTFNRTSSCLTQDQVCLGTEIALPVPCFCLQKKTVCPSIPDTSNFSEKRRRSTWAKHLFSIYGMELPLVTFIRDSYAILSCAKSVILWLSVGMQINMWLFLLFFTGYYGVCIRLPTLLGTSSAAWEDLKTEKLGNKTKRDCRWRALRDDDLMVGGVCGGGGECK